MTAGFAPARVSTPAPAPARRLGPLGGLRNSLTLTWRSLLKIPTNMEDLFSLSLTPIMYLLLFTYVFGAPSPATPTITCRPSCQASSC